MSSNVAKAAVGALALNGGAGGVDDTHHNPPIGLPIAGAENVLDGEGYFQKCPLTQYLPTYHDENICKPKPYIDRQVLYKHLAASGHGETLVPNQKTVVCPAQVQDLSNPVAEKGFDSTWIVENTASTPVVVAWVLNGKEYSPFHPDLSAYEDPEALLQPGEWTAIHTYESFIYHVREYKPNESGVGPVLLQHRAGLVPLGNPKQYDCDATLPDVEPINPETAKVKAEFQRTPPREVNRCNTIDIGFRNQVGCPLHVFWAGNLGSLSEVPDRGFVCSEEFKFHLGTEPAADDFLFEWESSVKAEASFIGHTYVARLASNPNIIIDSYTLEPTKIVDCPNLKQQQVSVSSNEKVAIEQDIADVDGSCDATSEDGRQAQLPNIAGAAAVVPDVSMGSN